MPGTCKYGDLLNKAHNSPVLQNDWSLSRKITTRAKGLSIQKQQQQQQQTLWRRHAKKRMTAGNEMAAARL
jgi:hypothetical protein